MLRRNDNMTYSGQTKQYSCLRSAPGWILFPAVTGGKNNCLVKTVCSHNDARLNHKQRSGIKERKNEL